MSTPSGPNATPYDVRGADGTRYRVYDRAGLERAACECYAAIRARFDAVFA